MKFSQVIKTQDEIEEEINRRMIEEWGMPRRYIRSTHYNQDRYTDYTLIRGPKRKFKVYHFYTMQEFRDRRIDEILEKL